MKLRLFLHSFVFFFCLFFSWLTFVDSRGKNDDGFIQRAVNASNCGSPSDQETSRKSGVYHTKAILYVHRYIAIIWRPAEPFDKTPSLRRVCVYSTYVLLVSSLVSRKLLRLYCADMLMWNGPFTLYLTVANLFKRIAGMLLQHLIYTFKSVVQNRLAENLIVLECQRVEPSQRCIYAWTHNSLSETNNTLVSCTLDKRSMTELSVDKPSGAEFTKEALTVKLFVTINSSQSCFLTYYWRRQPVSVENLRTKSFVKTAPNELDLRAPRTWRCVAFKRIHESRR